MGEISPALPATEIFVTEPRTHLNGEEPLYTDYRVVIKTTDIAFHRKESSVRRRYSEFAWLRNKLASTAHRQAEEVPALPSKAYFGRFAAPFIENRRRGLEKFLRELLSQTLSLSDRAVQLFVQTNLATSDIDLIVSGKIAYEENELAI